MAAKHLIECGHKEIGCITGPLIRHQAQMRYEGYKRALAEAELPLIQIGLWNLTSNVKVVTKPLKNSISVENCPALCLSLMT